MLNDVHLRSLSGLPLISLNFERLHATITSQGISYIPKTLLYCSFEVKSENQSLFELYDEKIEAAPFCYFYIDMTGPTGGKIHRVSTRYGHQRDRFTKAHPHMDY